MGIKQLPYRNSGQAVVEFVLVLPLFMGLLFIVFSLAFLAIFGQMTLYGTQQAARVAAVGGSAQQAAQEILPRLQVSGDGSLMSGQYQMRIGLTEGSGALSNPLRQLMSAVRTQVSYFQWPRSSGPQPADALEDDNPL